MRWKLLSAVLLVPALLSSQWIPLAPRVAEFTVLQVDGVTEFRNILKRGTSQGEDRSAEFASPAVCVAVRASATMNETAQNSDNELVLSIEVFDVDAQTWIELATAKRDGSTPGENLGVQYFKDDGSLSNRRLRIRSSNPLTMYYGIDAWCYPTLESIPDPE